MFDMPVGQICTNKPCTHLAIPVPWVGKGSTMDLVHGSYTWWCNCCCLRTQLEYAKRAAATIPDLEADLKQALQDCK